MNDTEQTNDAVTENDTDTVSKQEAVTENTGEPVARKKATKKKVRKKAVVKTTTEEAEAVAASVEADTAERATASSREEDKRTRLCNRLKEMGMMPGVAGAAVSKVAASSKKAMALNMPKWLTPQILSVAAGACVFTALIWALEQERQSSQPQTASRPSVYAPYGNHPAIPYPVQPPAQLQAPAQQVAPYYPPGGDVPVYQAQQQMPAAPNTQSGQATEQARPAYPAPAWYPNHYGYGYNVHPSMRLGFNGRTQGRGAGHGAAAPHYYGYVPPGYVPYYPVPPAYPQAPARGQQR